VSASRRQLRLEELLKRDARRRQPQSLTLLLSSQERRSIFAQRGKTARFQKYEFLARSSLLVQSESVLPGKLASPRQQALRDVRAAAADVRCNANLETAGLEDV
jgi:hypothetical protein